MIQETKFISRDNGLKIKALFSELIEDFMQEIAKTENNICSLGAFYDSDMTGFFLGYNTLERRIADDLIAKWWIPEWIEEDDFFTNDKRREEFRSLIYQVRESDELGLGYDRFALYQTELFDLTCETFKKSGEKGIFKGITKDFFMHVQQSDNDISDERKASLAKILSAQQIEEYLKFYYEEWCL